MTSATTGKAIDRANTVELTEDFYVVMKTFLGGFGFKGSSGNIRLY